LPDKAEQGYYYKDYHHSYSGDTDMKKVKNIISDRPVDIIEYKIYYNDSEACRANQQKAL
jgi:hypothetical protein